MKKKMICLFVLLILTGCNLKTPVSNEKNNDNSFTGLNGFQKININCKPISNIIDFSIYNNLFITSDGKLYEISFDKVFSNETNCDLIESDKKFIRFIKGGILDSEDEIYYYESENRVLQSYNSDSIIMPNQLHASSVPKSNYKNIIYSDEDFKYGENQMFYFYYDNVTKKIYNYSSDLYKINEEPLFSLDEDENIEYITYSGIKTNKAFYSYGRKAENKNECEKYADVKCIYKNGFYKIDDNNFIKQYQHIKFVQYIEDSYFILDENNNLYTDILGG